MVLLYFNSIKVRLKPVFLMRLICFIENFNSIKVRLKPMSPYYLDRILQNFNSIKVRLKRSAVTGLGAISEFQFHKGTIKTH